MSAAVYDRLVHLRVADAVVLSKTSPVLTCLVAHLWLGEPFNVYDVGAAVLCLVGVGMIAQATAAADRDEQQQQQHAGAPGDLGKLVAVAIVLASAVCAAIAYTTIRKLTLDSRGLKVDPMVLVLYFAGFCIPGGMVALQLVGDPVPQRVTRTQWLILTLGCGGLGFVGQTLLNLSFQMKNNVGVVATMQYVEIVYAMGWGVVLFDEGLQWQSVGGACLVMCCALITLLKNADDGTTREGKPGEGNPGNRQADEDVDVTGGPPLMMSRQLVCVNRRQPAEPPRRG